MHVQDASSIIRVNPWVNVYCTKPFLQCFVQLVFWKLELESHRIAQHTLHHLKYININDASNFFKDLVEKKLV